MSRDTKTEAAATRPAPAAPSEDAAVRPDTVRGILRRVCRGLWAQLALIAVFVNALALAVPIFVIQVYDRVVPYGAFETLIGLAVGVVLAIGFDFVLKQARSRTAQRAAMRVDAALTRALYARLTGLPLKQLEAKSDAEWRALLRDADNVRDLVAGSAAVLVIDLPFVLLFIGVVALAAPPLAGALLALVPIYIGVALLSSRIVGRSSRVEEDAARDKARLSEEVVAGRSVIAGLGLGPALRARYEAAQADAIRGAVVRGAAADGFNHAGGSLAMLTTVLLTSVGAVAVVGGAMTIGGLIAANMLAARVVQPLVQAISLWRTLERYRAAAGRLDAVLALTPARAESAVAHPRPSGIVSLSAVEFTYPNAAAPALRRVSATFRPGYLVGLVGANGSGKSTLLRALLGLYAPDEGRVLLDGADMAQFGRAELSRWIGYAPQDPFLFAGSIRDNIAKGREEVSDEAILRAAERAGAASFIADLPEGYGADVGEAGRALPPGRRQRIALARALVDDPAVLLLDEPTANLDFDAERIVLEQLSELKADRTIVVASHSRPLLERCDVVMVMEAGRIVMAGPPTEMLPRRAPTAAAETQSSGADGADAQLERGAA